MESASNTSFEHVQETVFKVWLEYPSNTAEIGYRDFMLIHYFDDRALPDVRFTYMEFV